MANNLWLGNANDFKLVNRFILCKEVVERIFKICNIFFNVTFIKCKRLIKLIINLGIYIFPTLVDIE